MENLLKKPLFYSPRGHHKHEIILRSEFKAKVNKNGSRTVVILEGIKKPGQI